MERIRINSLPPGFAPEHIRSQWVGLELPLITKFDIAEDPPSGWSIGSANQNGFMVRKTRAIEVLLNAEKEGAAIFWSNPLFGSYLQFEKECCELLPDVFRFTVCTTSLGVPWCNDKKHGHFWGPGSGLPRPVHILPVVTNKDLAMTILSELGDLHKITQADFERVLLEIEACDMPDREE